MRAARSRLAGQSRVVETARGPVEVAESGSGPPALVVHGIAGGFDMGLMVGRRDLGDGYRVIAPSRFGYLRTPLPADASHAAPADTLAALLDALAVPRAVVLAVSAWAQAATNLALRHPGRVQAELLATAGPQDLQRPGDDGNDDVIDGAVVGTAQLADRGQIGGDDIQPPPWGSSATSGGAYESDGRRCASAALKPGPVPRTSTAPMCIGAGPMSVASCIRSAGLARSIGTRAALLAPTTHP
jgi:pimeloyl-ACP methyl ester carboxylesterase